jgi:hypothetical protein
MMQLTRDAGNKLSRSPSVPVERNSALIGASLFSPSPETVAIFALWYIESMIMRSRRECAAAAFSQRMIVAHTFDLIL